MARFPILTDECVDGHFIKALRLRGWDVLHATDVFGEKTDDEALFAYAAEHGRVFVSADSPAQHIANRWFADGRRFHGVVWSAELARRGAVGSLVQQFEDWSQTEEPFENYPVRHLARRR